VRTLARVVGRDSERFLGGSDGADRDGYTSGRVGGCEHMASPVEDSAWINDHARRVHFTCDHALGFNLYATSGKYHAIKSAGDDDAIAFNLSLDSSAFTQDNGLLGYDISLDLAIDAERPF